MRRALFALLACTLAFPVTAPSACAAPGEPAQTAPGKLEWTIEADQARRAKGEVQLVLTHRAAENPWMQDKVRPVAGLIGLTAAQLGSESGNPVSFVLDKEPGAFVCEGMARRWRASGECVFHANAGFASELADRGFGLPSESQHFSLALHDIGRSFIDELARQGYARPTVAELVRAGGRGITVEFLREIKALGYSGLALEEIVRLRDHGVSADFIRRANASGGRRSVAELVAMRSGGRAEK